MKWLYVCILVLIAGAILSGVAVAREYDFRTVKWGMSQEGVIEKEGSPVDRSEDMLIYKIKVSGINLVLGYQFIDGILVKAAFKNNERYIDVGNYYDDYQTIKRALTDVYGAPDRDAAMWDDDMFKQMWSEKTAFQIGFVWFFSEWNMERTMIRHILRKEDFLSASHSFLYQSLLDEHQQLIDRVRKEELKRKL